MYFFFYFFSTKLWNISRESYFRLISLFIHYQYLSDYINTWLFWARILSVFTFLKKKKRLLSTPRTFSLFKHDNYHISISYEGLYTTRLLWALLISWIHLRWKWKWFKKTNGLSNTIAFGVLAMASGESSLYSLHSDLVPF